MTWKIIDVFVNEIYSKPPKNNYSTNKTDVYHIDDTWSLDASDLKNYLPESNRRCRHILVVIDHFKKFPWTVPSKNKNAQTKKDSRKYSYKYKKISQFDWDRPWKKNFKQNLHWLLKWKTYWIIFQKQFLGCIFGWKVTTFLNDLIHLKEMVIGLSYYPQKRGIIIIEPILLPN